MHWSQKYIGYSYAQFNCAQLVRRVLVVDFGLDYDFGFIPRETRDQSEAIKNRKDSFLTVTEKPREGDCVMMHSRREFAHIGIYAEINNQPYVLHSMNTIGSVVLHKLKDLKRYGLNVEGFYKWQS